ncbi:MAG: hemolysin family protein [Candidatus Aminicenantes bacterium]|nr:hemolysin family protein [Candidatus Aminicenantes bacterium]
MANLLFKIILVLVLFLVTFCLSLFSTALATSSRISLSRLLEDRNKKVREKILDGKEELRIAVEVWRTIFLAAFLLSLFYYFPRLHLWTIWALFSSLALVVFGFEFLPRLLYSLNRKAIFLLLIPVADMLSFLGRPAVSFLRKEESLAPGREATEEEIETFIDEAREEGIIEKEEGPLLRSVVEFGDTLVREIMTPRVDMICIRKDASLAELKELISQEKYSRIPVYRERIDNIEGLAIVKDLLIYSDEEAKRTPVEKIMRPVYFVPESMRVKELLKEFQKRKQKMAVVVDEHGGIAGLVTMKDIVEEIVGEIRDEYDTEEEKIISVSNDEYIVSGETKVEELEPLLSEDLTNEEYLTVGGLVSHHLGRLPYKGEVFYLKNLRVEVLEADQKKVIRIKIKKEKNKV